MIHKYTTHGFNGFIVRYIDCDDGTDVLAAFLFV